MPTFKATATAVLAANRLMGHRKKTANARQHTHSSSSINDATENRLRAIECSIKKIELQLKLVDGEIMSNKEFKDLTSEILDCDKPNFTTMDETMDFLRSVDNKRADNRYKYVLKIVSIICPLLSACNIGFLKEINTEELSSELIGDAINKSTGYLSTVTTAINYFIENGNDGSDKLDKLIDLNVISSDAFDNYRDIAGVSKVMIGKMTHNVFILQKELGKYLIIKSKKISNRLHNKMSWKILSKTFCTCIFYFILFSSIVGIDVNKSIKPSNKIMEIMGGKKKKHKKKLFHYS